MKAKQGYDKLVRAWIEETGKDLTSDQLVQIFEQAINLLWKRARASLSAVMLVAVFDRILFNCSEKYPLINLLQVAPLGIGCEKFRESARALDRAEVAQVLEVLITEFLAILGNLTNEVISSDLYSELSKIKFEPRLKALPKISKMSGEEK